MNLDPREFHCPDHGDDLTTEVRSELGDEGVVTGFAVDFASPSSRYKGSFSVIVTCPGNGQPHKVVFKGRVL